MGKRLTFEQAQQRLIDAGQELELLEFNGSNSQCKVKCNLCNEIFITRFDSLTTRNKNGQLYKSCSCTHSEKISFQEAQKRLFDAGQNLELLEFNGTHQIALVKCLDCEAIFKVKEYRELITKQKNGNFNKRCKCKIIIYNKLDWRQFEQRVLNKNPNIEIISEQIWKGNNEYYKCRCKVDGKVWLARGGHLLAGHGCPECAAKRRGDNNRKSNEEYIVECKALGLEVLEKYKRADIPIRHRCLECGTEFTAAPNNILTNHTGCPKCRESTSSGEQLILNYLEDNNIDFIYQCRCNINNHRHYYDFYLPQYNLFVEIDGGQHRKPVEHWGGKPAFNNQQIKDAEKDMHAHWHGYNMIRISDELSNLKMIDTLKREIEYINS